MVKSLIALAMIPRLMNPSQTDIEQYVNNYINNTCQYLRYIYDETSQSYNLKDKINYFNQQNSDTQFDFTLYLDYVITERITHFWTLGESITIYLADQGDDTTPPNIMGTCEKILTLDTQENKYKVFNCMANTWETIEPIVLNKIPTEKVANEIFVLNSEYANNSELYKAGTEAGYAIGYKTGYGDGKVATTPLNNVFDLFKKISTSLSSFWNIPILPGINLGLLISIPITTGIVVWVVKALKE